jgi:uncharacterized protein YdeI (YjbR/CyaY-like superfamily)
METKLENGKPTLHPPDRKAWRTWLQMHHASGERVWLIIYHKDSGKANMNYAEAVEEALCFGWIDGQAAKRDAHSHYQSFGPRNPKSVWSKLNKSRVARLMADGLMAPAGMAMVEAAKENGMWGYLDAVEAEVVPDDLQKALDGNAAAWEHWQKFPPSARKQILHWILDAKRPETRERRIAQTVELAGKGVRVNEVKGK